MQRQALKPDGIIVAVILALLGTSGFNVLLIMAAIVSGLIDGLHLSAATAGRIAACDGYGLSVGAIIAVLIVRKLPWRPLIYTLLCVLIALDLGTTLIHSVGPLMVMRAAHGVVGGALIGISYGVFARSGMPDRCFGMLCTVQGLITGFGLMFLPRLVLLFGPSVLFLTLAGLSAVALALTPLLPAFEVFKLTAINKRAGSWAMELRSPLSLAVLAVFFFQCGNSALAAYIIELGRSNALSLQFITTTIGIAGWIGMLGALLVVIIGTRYGRAGPIAIGTLSAILFNAAFHASAAPIVYVVANLLSSMVWYFSISFLFGLCAAFDRTGRSAAIASVASKFGYATGPFIASFLIGSGSVATYRNVINLTVASLCISAALGIVASRRSNGASTGALATE